MIRILKHTHAYTHSKKLENAARSLFSIHRVEKQGHPDPTLHLVEHSLYHVDTFKIHLQECSTSRTFFSDIFEKLNVIYEDTGWKLGKYFDAIMEA